MSKTPEIEESGFGRKYPLNRDELLRLYAIADESHRFFVEKRFKILSLYFPTTTLVLSGLYYLSKDMWYYRSLLSLIAVILVLFLYSVEARNWVLSNTCSDTCAYLGRRIESEGGEKKDKEKNLHEELKESYEQLPDYSTWLDRRILRLAKKITQHTAVYWLTISLVVVWLFLMAISIPGVIDRLATFWGWIISLSRLRGCMWGYPALVSAFASYVCYRSSPRST